MGLGQLDPPLWQAPRTSTGKAGMPRRRLVRDDGFVFLDNGAAGR